MAAFNKGATFMTREQLIAGLTSAHASKPHGTAWSVDAADWLIAEGHVIVEGPDGIYFDLERLYPFKLEGGKWYSPQIDILPSKHAKGQYHFRWVPSTKRPNGTLHQVGPLP
jgi:hypothetical protein